MFITLKKANELQRHALEMVGKIDPKVTVEVSSYSKGDPESFVPQMFHAASTKWAQAIKDTRALLAAAYQIRRLLGIANADAEGSEFSINDLLAQRAMVEAEEKRLSALLASAEHGLRESDIDRTVSQITQQRKALERGTEMRYSLMTDHVDLCVVTQVQIDALKETIARLRHDKSALTDIISGRNLNTTFKVPEDVEETLRYHKIILS